MAENRFDIFEKGEIYGDRTSTPQNDCCRGKHPVGV